jgi:small conductance mechanosensitive channel
MSAICLFLVSSCLAQVPSAPPKATVGGEAEKITRLERYIEEDQKQLAAIKKHLEDPNSEYRRAEAAFKMLDEILLKQKNNEAQLRKEGKIEEADALVELKRQWRLAHDRFELAIQERKALQEKAKSLPGKIERQRKALDKIVGGVPEPAENKKPGVENKKTDSPARSGIKPATKPGGSEQPAENSREKPMKESKKLREAREKAKAKEEAALQAKDKLKAIIEYLDGLKEQIAIEQTLLETARKKAALARQTRSELEEEQKRKAAKATPEEIATGLKQISEASRRVDEAGTEEREISDNLADLQAQLARVQARQIQIMDDAKRSDREAKSAEDKVAALENPFAPRNVLRWLTAHAGKLLATLLGMMALYLLVRTGARRIIRVMSAARKRQGGRESEDRAETLVGVFRNTMSAFILCGGVLMLLDEVGIPIVPLMGGAAVAGLAVAFGAQNLIKDYFTGFMVLLEDQYAVHDIVKINNIGGQVERISLRMTVLRDLSGVAHFIPHGAIQMVSNMTHGWSRAALEVSISYNEDVDRALGVLQGLCAELRSDDEFAPLLLEDAEMLGVDALTEKAVVLKFVIKTRAQEQWKVKRELLRRIKRRFDELGIETPSQPRGSEHHPGLAA